MLTEHETVAIALAAMPAAATGEKAVAIGQRSRQGDVLITSLRDAAKPGHATPQSGVLVQAGRNGEHRLVASQCLRVGDAWHLAEGGLLVHTDKPSDRHAPHRLAPGVWHFDTQQELGLDGVLRAVRD